MPFHTRKEMIKHLSRSRQMPSFRAIDAKKKIALIKEQRFSSNYVEGTRSYQETNPAISSGGFWIKNYDQGSIPERKYAPFDQVKIINNQSNDIVFYRNQNSDDKKIIPANTLTVINKPLFSWKIENVGTTTISAYANGAGVVVEVSKERLSADKRAYLEGQALNQASTAVGMFGHLSNIAESFFGRR